MEKEKKNKNNQNNQEKTVLISWIVCTIILFGIAIVELVTKSSGWVISLVLSGAFLIYTLIYYFTRYRKNK